MRDWADQWKRKLGPAQSSFVGLKQKSTKYWAAAGRDERAISEIRVEGRWCMQPKNQKFFLLILKKSGSQDCSFQTKFFAGTIDKEFDFLEYSTDERSSSLRIVMYVSLIYLAEISQRYFCALKYC